MRAAEFIVESIKSTGAENDCWVSPSGVYIPTEETHADTAVEILNLRRARTEDGQITQAGKAYTRLLRLGYIRLGFWFGTAFIEALSQAILREKVPGILKKLPLAVHYIEIESKNSYARYTREEAERRFK